MRTTRAGLSLTVVRAAAMLAALVPAGALVSASALAAPFCIGNQAVPPQCIYYDPAECQRDAQRQQGVCSVNQAEFHMAAGPSEYCVVTSGNVAECIYPDRDSCSNAAGRQHGTCARAQQSAPSQVPDPYSDVEGQ